MDVVAFGHELNVEWTADIQCFRDRTSIPFNVPNRTHVQLLRWENNRGVTTVYPCVFQVLSNRVVENRTVVSHCVKLNLFRIQNELRHHNRFVVTNICCQIEEVAELFSIGGDTHGCSREDKAWSNKYRIPNGVSKLSSLVLGSQHGPRRLVDAKTVQHGGEQFSIFSSLNVASLSAENVDTAFCQWFGKIVWDLAPNRHNNSGNAFAFIDIQNAFGTQLFKVQSIAFVKVSTNSFGVVVDDDTLESVSS